MAMTHSRSLELKPQMQFSAIPRTPLFFSKGIQLVQSTRHILNPADIDETLTGTATPSQSGPGSNGNDTLQIFRTETSPSDAI